MILLKMMTMLHKTMNACKNQNLNSDAWAVILAAGTGSRMGKLYNGLPKQFLAWKNRPLYWHSVLAFARCACIKGIVLVFSANMTEFAKDQVKKLAVQDNVGVPVEIAAGGDVRQKSAMLGLKAVPENVQKVLIHDAARPFFSASLAWQICENLSDETPCIIPAIPVKDTIKIIKADNLAEATLPRERLRAVQTPQGFMANNLRKAHELHAEKNLTDDAALFEYMGIAVTLVQGEENNMKITSPEDLKFLLLEEKSIPVTGFGYDVHKFGTKRELRLGGIEIPCKYRIDAHSDGDVLLHALMDAILGCCGLGDIGRHFPDSDITLDNISSVVLLDHVLELSGKAGLKICNADITIAAQKPAISPWRKQIQKNIARLLALDACFINIKATTEEGLGFTGRQEGIKCYAVVSGLRYEMS